MLEILLKKFGKPVITLREAAAYLQMAPSTLMADPTFPITERVAKKHTMRFVKVAALARWLEK